MDRKTLASLALAVAAFVLPGCATEYGEADRAAEGTASLRAPAACGTAALQVTDGFDRSSALGEGWKKGRVSDGTPTVKTIGSAGAKVAVAAKTSAVLASRVAAETEEDAKATSYIEREVPTSGCIAAEFSVVYTESAPFPADAWTYFFWIDGSADMNISLFRQGNTVRLAAQRGGTELSRIDVDVPPGKWTKIRIEVELDIERPTMSIAVADGEPKQVTLAEPLPAPYFVSVGTWSRGQVPSHEFWWDNLKLWY